MNDLALINTSNYEEQGNEINKTNPFFRDLCSIMKNKEFKSFYNEYFQSWNDVECMIFYMKLYNTVEYEFNERYHTPISDDLMSFTLNEIMKKDTLRKKALALFKTYKNDLSITHSKPLRSLLTFATPPQTGDKLTFAMK